MSFDAYKVAVKLSLVNNVTTGLLAITSQLKGVNKGFGSATMSAALFEKKLHDIKRLGMIGGAMTATGAGMLAMFKGPLEEAKKFQTETAKFASLGFGAAVNNEAVQFARGMKTIGTSATENMALVSDAMAVFKDIHHARMAAPIMADMKFANHAVFGEKGGANESKFMDMLKVIEFRGGLSSDKEFETQANFVQKVISGSRNRVDASQLLAALKTGGVGLSQRSNRDFYLGAEPLIQEFGGQRYGTGAMSIYQNLVQARGTMAAQNELLRLGLLDPSKIKQNGVTGKLQKVSAGAFKGSDILQKEGELALLEKVLLPAFAAKGITSDSAIINELGMVLSNRTGSSLMARIYQQRATIHKQSEANESAMDIVQLKQAGKNTLIGKQVDLHAKFRDLMLELGNTVLPMAISALTKLIPIVRSLTEWMREHKTAVKFLAVAFVGLGAALAIGGTVTLITAAFGGLSLAVAPLGIAIGALSAPIAIAVLAIATLSAALFAFGPLSKKEIQAARTDGGVNLTPSVKADIERINAVKTGASKTVQVQTNVNVDGQKLASVMSKHQAKAANFASLATGTDFDMSRSVMPVAGSWR